MSMTEEEIKARGTKSGFTISDKYSLEELPALPKGFEHARTEKGYHVFSGRFHLSAPEKVEQQIEVFEWTQRVKRECGLR